MVSAYILDIECKRGVKRKYSQAFD